MAPNLVAGLVSFIGTATQLGGALLLAAFFLLLRGHARRRPYFRAWSLSWVWMTIALAAVFSLYVVGWVSDEHGAKAIWFVYQLFKLFFLSSLLAGALAYARGLRPARVQRIAVPASVAYAVVTVLPASGLNEVVAMQGPVAAAALATCAYVLLRLPPSRATLGSRATGVFFALLAVIWVNYSLFFAQENVGSIAGFFMRHNSYVDLLLQMLLGYGMVVLLMEDAKREVDDAHAQLAVAHDELKRVALHDSLTGALNRRAWSEGVGLDAVRASFGAAVMLDLDNLKVVNDVHGHAAGDELLRRVCDVLRAAIRPSDRLYRWGGDEFLLVMPGARAADVRRKLDDVVARANEAEEDAAEHPALQWSVGAADFRGGEDLEAAVRRADAAMYDDKSRRRVARGVLQPAGD
jgi:diguanylate cyclase (GGDEF)-like protein